MPNFGKKMMNPLSTICFVLSLLVAMFFFQPHAFAQIPLVDIEGNTKIRGNVDLAHTDDTTTIHIGLNAGIITDFSSNRHNTFVGSFAGYNNTTGNLNSFFGQKAGEQDTSGSANSFFGQNAGRRNQGDNNSFFGQDAGSNNSLGHRNSFFGQDAGSSNGFGSENSFFGQSAGQSNTGSLNSFFGYAAGLSNTNGYRNSFFGRVSGVNNTTGVRNSFFGDNSGFSTTTGSSNSFFGQDAGNNNETGNQNSFFGQYAGYYFEKGAGNTFLGYGSGIDFLVDSLDYAIAIGYQSIVDCNNCAVIGGTGASAVKVGIGLRRPQQNLHVHEGQFEDNYVQITNAATPGMGLLVGVQNDGQGSIKHLNAADIIFGTGNGDILIMKDNGRIGIGTLNPTQKHHLHEDAASTQNLMKITNVATGSTNTDGLDVGIHTDGSGRLFLQENLDLAFGTNGQIRATIKNSGKFGIGTSGPTQKLHIHEDAASTQNLLKITNAATGVTNLDGLDVGVHTDGSGRLYLQEDLDLEFGTNGLRRVSIKNTGEFGIGTSDPLQKLHLHENAGGSGSFLRITNALTGSTATDGLDVGLSADGSASISLLENKDLKLATHDITRATIKNNGDIGIGISTPVQKVHIHESLTATRNFLRMTNDITGSTSSDGLDLGIESNGDAILWMKENKNLKLATNNSVKLMILNNGNIGIGENNPNVALDVNGSIEYTGNLTKVSDMRLKENIEKIPHALDKILELSGFTYNLIGDEERTSGVSAQDVQKILPEAVGKINKEYLGVDYTQLTPLLIEAIKELNQIVIQQKEEIKALKRILIPGTQGSNAE